jgi:hypothetical protein
MVMSREEKLLRHCTYENSLSYNEIKDMSEAQLSQLITMCWHESFGRTFNEETFRCDSDGIKDIKYANNKLEWESDDSECGYVQRYDADEKIHQLGDGEWDYGIYKPL